MEEHLNIQFSCADNKVIITTKLIKGVYVSHIGNIIEIDRTFVHLTIFLTLTSKNGKIVIRLDSNVRSQLSGLTLY